MNRLFTFILFYPTNKIYSSIKHIKLSQKYTTFGLLNPLDIPRVRHNKRFNLVLLVFQQLGAAYIQMSLRPKQDIHFRQLNSFAFF